ncbi:MAG: hypothetical protein WA629_04710 [Candidatus Aquilonibacter sp.]
MKLRLPVLAVLATALLAAVSAHVGIDVLGDYLVRDDSYDHLAHDSRLLFTAIALLLAAAAAVQCFLYFCTAAASIQTRVRLLHLRPAQIACACALIALLALLVVPAMETIDALQAGADIDSLADAFGGSILLGVVTTLACAVAWCGLIVALVGWFARQRERAARLLYELLVPSEAPLACAHTSRENAPAVAIDPNRHARCRSKRGPPRAASLIPVH